MRDTPFPFPELTRIHAFATPNHAAETPSTFREHGLRIVQQNLPEDGFEGFRRFVSQAELIVRGLPR